LRNLFLPLAAAISPSLLGIALGSAVLTGALLRRRFAARQAWKTLTLDQLGWVEEAMFAGPAFFRGRSRRQTWKPGIISFPPGTNSPTRLAG